jgi:voltage-gated potassium channel
MANVVVRPKVAEFMDIVTLNSGLELWLEELVIDAGSPLADKTVGEADVRRRTGASLVGLIRGEDTVMITPDADTCIEAGDLLIVLGTREQLSELERLSTLGGWGNREGKHD